MRIKDQTGENRSSLVARKEILIRFSEVDIMGVVWHGNYIKFFEDGREAFGNTFDLDLVKIYRKEGVVTPVVKVTCDYKKSLGLGDVALVETTLMQSAAAKIIFQYRIFNQKNGDLMATGETVQVFVKEGVLQIAVPDFFAEWKEKWLSA